MQFINKQNDAAFAGGDFLEKRLQTVLKFTAIFGARDHRADVHGHELLVFQGLGHITADDAASEAFGNGGLAHARFADEHGIVFGAPGQDLHDAADFLVASDDGINLARAGQGGEVAPVFIQGLKLVLGILIGDTLVAAQFGQRLEHFRRFQTVSLENLFQRRVAFKSRPRNKCSGADVICVT